MLNRIIGILVLVAMGVLTYPFLINHHDGILNAEVIKAPPFPSQQTQNDTIQAIGDHVASRADSSTVSSNNTKLKNHAKTNAWVVQIGPSKDKINALRLVNQLRAKGYNAFIYQKGAAFGEQVSVYVGPEIKRNLAEGLASKVSQETNISTSVKSYKPLTT